MLKNSPYIDPNWKPQTFSEYVKECKQKEEEFKKYRNKYLSFAPPADNQKDLESDREELKQLKESFQEGGILDA